MLLKTYHISLIRPNLSSLTLSCKKVAYKFEDYLICQCRERDCERPSPKQMGCLALRRGKYGSIEYPGRRQGND